MKKTLFIIIALLVHANLLVAQQFKSSYKKISLDEGLSQASVNSLFQDKNGFIWAGTFDGLNRYDGNEVIVYRNNPTDSTSISDNIVNDVIEDKGGNLWIATGAGGVCKFNPETNQFKRYLNQPDGNSRISDNVTFVIHKDNNDRIWVGHRKGLDLYNEAEDKFEPVNMDIKPGPGSTIFNMITDNSDLWLATGSGLKLFNTETLKIEKVYQNNPQDKNSISSNALRRVTIDRDGLLWVLTLSYALNSIDTQTGKITRYFQDPVNNKGINNPRIKYIDPGKSGIIWLATEFYGLIMLDKKTGTLKYPDQKPLSPTSYANYQAENIFQDAQGSIWVGTLSDGIIHYDTNANSFGYKPNLFESPYDSRTDAIRTILEAKDGTIWLSSDKKGLSRIDKETGEIDHLEPVLNALKIDKLRVNDIIQDSSGLIWIGTRDHGFIRIDPETGDFKIFYNKLDAQNIIRSNSFHLIHETTDGLLWLGSVGVLTAFNPETEEINIYGFNPTEKNSLPGTIISALYEDVDKNLWIGFFSEGLYKLDRKTNSFTKADFRIDENFNTGPIQITYIYQNKKDILWVGTTKGLLKYNLTTNSVKPYTTKNGLAHNTVYVILEDKTGNLWLSTNSGISRFNPKSETFKNYNREDGLKQSEFNYQAAHIGLKTGLMYFAGSKGFNFFNPNEITQNQNIPPVVFTEFKKYDTNGDFETVAGINYKNEIRLDYNNRDFSLKIAALDYTNPSKNQYAYWLEGYNQNWVELGTRREINFTNLSPGKYTLKVKGSNNDGVWNEQGKSLQISILPPWWSTWWAYTLYALILLSLLYAAYKYRINQLEALRLKELDEAKRKMYTNITHEFRTPLTVISGISKELRERSQDKDSEHWDIIDRSSKNMLYLVNQLLELRKMEIGKTEIDYIQDDIIAYLKYISSSFKSYAETKNITLHFVSISEKLVMDYDPDKLLMILSNLLSNAIKYSKPDSDVYLQVEELENALQIRVVDYGLGIPEHKLPHIFDRFYKVQTGNEDNIDGVGIGLAVTKELTELMNGKIEVTSNVNKGSIFSLTLPVKNTAPLAKATIPEIEKTIKKSNKLTNKLKEITKKQPHEEALQLLIIEDNKNIIAYLKTFLQHNWNLTITTDGQKGIDKALETVPDIILCDLMMPNANGYQVLETLKSNTTTSHIPIVILTAKADEESRLEAYKKGADAYLLKPFNKEELEIILQKLAHQRKLLQERYQTQATLRFAEGVEIHQEDTFIKKLEELVLNEDTNKTYSISDLCQDLGMSRTQLHNKIKALTGKSTSIFVRSLRLQKGKYLLENTTKGISEIAYHVGFNNPSYFTKSFTEEFGIPPSYLRK